MPRTAQQRRLPKVARESLRGFISNINAADDESGRADRARRNKIRAVIEANAASAAFDPQAARTLATRDLFGEACGALAKAVKWPASGAHCAPHVILWQIQADNLCAFRIAFAFGIAPLSLQKKATEIITRDWLRSRAPWCTDSRVALALMGECWDWSAAGPRERAGFLLHHMVERCR